MEQFGGWSCDFAMPHMLLRWLGTVAAARNYLSCEQADDTVTVAMATHVAISWCCYPFVAYFQAPSRISSLAEFRSFFFSLPEFHIWCSTATALNVAIVTTFFLPKEEVVLAVWCYLVGYYSWLFDLALEAFRSSRRGEATDADNSDISDFLGRHAASTRKKN